MSLRSLVLLSVVATAFCAAPSALADIPNPTTGSGGSTSSSSTGTGGSTTGAGGSTANLSCNISQEETAGSTCQECGTGAKISCSSLDSSYSYACQQTPTVAVWCNGPVRDEPSDQNVACSVAVPGGAWSGLAAAGALAAAVAMQLRRRRRS
jgi:hypothetical protein